MSSQETERNDFDAVLQDALGGEPPREVERRLRERLTAFRGLLARGEAPAVRTRRHALRWAIPIPLAAALVAVLLMTRSAGPTFAEVIAKVRAAQTLTFKMSIQVVLPTGGSMEMPYDCMVDGAKFRSVGPGGVIMIMDGQGRGLTLDPGTKMALALDAGSRPTAANPGIGFLDGLRALQGSTAEILGRREIDGHQAVGFHVIGTSGIMNGAQPATVDWTIWADAQSGLTVRIEMGSSVRGIEAHTVMNDFVFDPELDESLFSLNVPAGYTRQEVNVDMSQPKEADLLSALGEFAKTSGGTFPAMMKPAVSTADRMAQVSEISAQTAAALARSAAQSGGRPSPEQVAAAIKVSTGLQRAVAFVDALPPESKWHYSSAGVRLGDADKPLCWWLPAGSKTYRAVYGDLSVRDVAPDALPAK
jgi:outer membrane lipoprotein-sorting protein